jgi:hypothetical protein
VYSNQPSDDSSSSVEFIPSDGESNGTDDLIKEGLKGKAAVNDNESSPLHTGESLFTSASQKGLYNRSPSPLFLPESNANSRVGSPSQWPELPLPSSNGPFYPFPSARQKTSFELDLDFLDKLL